MNLYPLKHTQNEKISKVKIIFPFSQNKYKLQIISLFFPTRILILYGKHRNIKLQFCRHVLLISVLNIRLFKEILDKM